jgi:hypothetical protein
VRKLLSIFVVVFLLGTNSILAQKKSAILVAKDSIKKDYINPLAPAKAAFYSAILPGLGQAYNKKYWKIPLVYGGIGAGIYYFSLNSTKYQKYRDAYKRRLAGYNDDEFQYLDDSRLIVGQRFYQRNRDMSMMVIVGFYVLNIIDANIDAHLMQFNVSDNLSFRPDFFQNEIDNKHNLGLTLNYQF